MRNLDIEKNTADIIGSVSGGLMCKLRALFFYSTLVLIDSFVLRNPPEQKDSKPLTTNIKFKKLNV